MLKRKNSQMGIADVDSKRSTVIGYASKFGNVDSHGDIVMKGSFARTIKNNGNRVKTLLHHDPVQIIGKPLVMREDDKGLYTETKVSNTALGRDLLTLIEDGVIDEMSIGFIPIREEYDKETKANLIHEIRLVEYSFVSLASNPEARVEGMKGLAMMNEIAASMKRAEKALRDGSFETDEIPEALSFIIKYWRTALENSDLDSRGASGAGVIDSDNVVSSLGQESDSPSGTRSSVTDPAVATQDGLLAELNKWNQEQEVLEMIRKLGKLLEVK
jgi:HK97 family phage prohead protease